MFNSQGHIAMGSLRVEEPVHTSWSRFCTVNHRALASNYQLSNMKRPARDSNQRPQRLEASTLTATPPSPPPISLRQSIISCIPKSDKPREFFLNWHPISLLSVLYKVMSATLVNRTKKVLDKLISDSQTGFIKGWYI